MGEPVVHPVPDLDLLPCPLCGGKAEVTRASDFFPPIARCKDRDGCGCSVPGDNYRDVALRWNRRAD